MSELNCPCGHGIYTHCCEPLHRGQRVAESAEQLMRSRYSAFAKHEIDYIVSTTASGQQSHLDITAIRDWAMSNQWLKLEVIQHLPRLDKTHAQVEFKAHYQNGDQVHVHHETSNFVFINRQWYFLDPTTDQTVTMKQACICGSGKKFKQCCARFL